MTFPVSIVSMVGNRPWILQIDSEKSLTVEDARYNHLNTASVKIIKNNLTPSEYYYPAVNYEGTTYKVETPIPCQAQVKTAKSDIHSIKFLISVY